MKLDLHVHTLHSRRPSIWLLQKLGCPESFTNPVDAYHALKRMGMSHVTFTDHNCIGGCLDVAHLPDTFISEEITAYFPEDRCKVHVLAYDISEDIHRDIQLVRENIYELIDYLKDNDIPHAIAHPFSAVNDWFTAEHFEKLLLLFRVFEINGDQEQQVNDMLRHIIGTLTREEIERLSEKHGLDCRWERPWEKAFITGSDDHSGTRFGRSYTRVGGAESTGEFFDSVQKGAASINAQSATGRSFARDVYSVAYYYLKERFDLHKFCGSDLMLRFANSVLEPNRDKKYGLISNIGFAFGRRRQAKQSSGEIPFLSRIRNEAAQLIHDNEDLMRMVSENKHGIADDGSMWFDFVNRISNRTLSHLAKNLIERLAGGDFFHLFHTLGSAGSLYLMLAPYFVSYPFYSAERRLARCITGKLRPDKKTGKVRLGHFTDTFNEVNGVALTIKRNFACAEAQGRDMTVITSYENPQPKTGVHNFAPVYVHPLPEYTEMSLSFPPFLELLDYCYDKDFTYIHLATPGPVGLAGLAVARTLGTPVCATYHTAIADYADALTGDKSLADMVWKYMAWFYNQMDMVLVSSQYSYNELAEKGVQESKLRIFPRGVDCNLFAPEKRNEQILEKYGISRERILLYAGRVSREKGLQMLAEVFPRIEKEYPDVALVVCGDGPYRDEMQARLKDTGAVFTGFLPQDEVAALYASAHTFVFPSSTDTFGNVVLEAQASGLPVIVSDTGGPCEIIRKNITGLIFHGGDTSELEREIRRMLDLPQAQLEEMKKAARKFAEQRSFERAFEETWQFYSPSRNQNGSDEKRSCFPSMEQAVSFKSVEKMVQA